MNYFKKSLALLLVTGLMISQAQAGIKVEVDGCNLVQPVINGVVKGLTNTFDILGRIRVPTISYVNRDNHTITVVYKNLLALAGGFFLTGAIAACAYLAEHYQDSKRYRDSSFKTMATGLSLMGIGYATLAGLCFFDPSVGALTETSYFD